MDINPSYKRTRPSGFFQNFFSEKVIHFENYSNLSLFGSIYKRVQAVRNL